MSNLKRYKVTHDWHDHTVTLEVDTEKLTAEKATLINEFWGDDDHRLDSEDDDPVRAVIRLFGQSIIAEALRNGGADFSESSKGIFGGNPGTQYSEEQQDEEGWGGKDETGFGWCGIRVIAADVQGVGYDDVTLKPIDPAAAE